MSGRNWLLAFALAFPTVVTYAHFVVATSGEPATNPKLLALYTVGKLTGLLLPVVYYFVTPRAEFAKRARGTDSSQTRLAASQGIVLGLVFGLAVGVAILVLYRCWLADSPTFASASKQVRAKVTEFGIDTPERFAAFAVFLSLAHSLFEEYYWRWFAFGGLRSAWPFWAAALLASLAFMGHHVVVLSVYFPGAFWRAVLPFSLGVAAGGVVWCWLYERSGSLVGPWLSHVLIDSAIVVVGYDLVFGRS